ncbi:MAG TPA: CHAT domain-containing protein [Opitutaceae bacterium]
MQRGEEQSMAVSDLASLLPDDHTVLLEFAVLDEEAFVFVARRTQEAKSGTPDVNLTVHRLEASPATLRSLAQEVQERCEMRSLAQRLGVVRRELYVALLEPATGDIAGAHTLVIIPDDFLWQVPFAALERGDGSCVLDHHALAYAPSAHAWRAMRRLRERHAVLLAGNSSPAAGLPTLLAVANPDLGATRPSAMPLLGGFDAIPGTERQGRAIAALFGERATALIGAEATEERTRAECGSHRLLHFATHGVFDSASPLHSGLLLTPGPNDDGYFTAREIMEHNLNADLMVLSACSTARGGMRAGEGILGLSWALFVAGAPSSVLTQWKVADESTADLMVEFYRRLQQYLTSGTAEGSLASKAECLRQAQLGLRKNVAWSHPFFWAPFVLVGDPE